MNESRYTKQVTLVKGESKIVAHLSRGTFTKFKGKEKYTVDGEFGRSGYGCSNDWHGDYTMMKDSFIMYVGEKVLDGYQVESVVVS